MKKITAILASWLILAMAGASANDGVFYAQGNQLIPITESEITVQKEILTLNSDGAYVEVIVYYEFFNPTGKTKTLLVGFEAAAPYPYEGIGHFPEQPNIHDFKVIMNGKDLPFKVAHVENELMVYDKLTDPVPPYYINGVVKDWTRNQCLDAIEKNNEFDFPFDYVYHFNAEFKPGVNTVKHTYRYRISESVDMEWTFPYVLTAACRWANRQIDDFTLNVNMGDRESFFITTSFFKSVKEWTVKGVGKSIDGEAPYGEPAAIFHMREGGISFHKKNFCPDGELLVYKPRAIWGIWNDDGVIFGEDVIETNRSMYIDWSLLLGDQTLSFSDKEKRIMKNLPFAKRGYVFKSKDLQDYFESTEWYIPDPAYVADMTKFPASEQNWVQFWMK